ncbi:MAG: hypothetical protein E6G88_03675 [Alphaproteobacteria bacterium]|nr:MAG: hypothetical protein E6G88_03675 [Alphaproteobacteria bacterium]
MIVRDGVRAIRSQGNAGASRAKRRSGARRRCRDSRSSAAVGAPRRAAFRQRAPVRAEDGRLVEVVAEAEPLVEVRAVDAAALARIAFHLGDRHVPVQLFSNRIRLRRDHALESLIAALGGKCAKIEAPFDPEGGAYVEPAHAHPHAHDAHSHGPHTHGSAGHKHHSQT